MFLFFSFLFNIGLAFTAVFDFPIELMVFSLSLSLGLLLLLLLLLLLWPCLVLETVQECRAIKNVTVGQTIITKSVNCPTHRWSLLIKVDWSWESVDSYSLTIKSSTWNGEPLLLIIKTRPEFAYESSLNRLGSISIGWKRSVRTMNLIILLAKIDYCYLPIKFPMRTITLLLSKV